MNGRFWIFGIIVSVIVHVGFLAVLSFSSKGTSPSSESVPAPSSEAASSTVPESVPAVPASAGHPPVSNETRPASTPVARPPARPVTLPAANATPVQEPAPTPEAEWVTYTVKKGDWLERLCKKAGCSVSEAARYNKTTYKKLSNLKVGQKIKLPKFQEN